MRTPRTHGHGVTAAAMRRGLDALLLVGAVLFQVVLLGDWDGGRCPAETSGRGIFGF